MSLDEEARQELAELEAAGRRRVPRVLEGAQGPRAIVDGREVLNFASNDYLGLAGDPRLVKAAQEALEVDGVGAGASRLIVGNHRAHVELEAGLADWLGVGGVQLFNTGFAANVGVLGALLRAGDAVFSDALNHASIIDGCRLSRAEVVVFPHRDYGALERALAGRTARRKLVVSESLFSMDGDLADVETLAALARRYGAVFVLDEAHAIGAMGPEGRGVAAGAGVVPDVVIGTFGKAFGSFGAFAATTRSVSDLLWNRARTLVFSTAMPPSVAAATSAALELVRGGEGERRRALLAANARELRALLAANARELRAGVAAAGGAGASVATAGGAGVSVATAGGAEASAIAPVVIGDEGETMACTSRMLSAGVFVQGIRPPTVPVGTSRLRISLSAGHTPEDVRRLASSLSAVLRETHLRGVACPT
jgi:8-amino-7-oxononanoate synthase